MRFLTIPLVLALALAGCIDTSNDSANPAADGTRTATEGGSMTGAESEETTSGLCTEDFSIGDKSQTFCAKRVITLSGSISGIPKMDVDLATFNGDVKVAAGTEGAWRVVATLQAQGETEAAAVANLDRIAFEWAHEEGGRHFIEAEARHEDRDSGQYGLGADLHATLPPSLVAVLVAATSNGDITLDDLKTDGLAATTSNGRVRASGEVTHVSLTTSNGDVDASLAPTASGRVSLVTSNGEVTLKLTEGPSVGYELTGTTSNGDVDIRLQDGTVGPCPAGSEYYTPPCSTRSFTTHGFDQRDIRSYVDVVSSNGDIDVAPP